MSHEAVYRRPIPGNLNEEHTLTLNMHTTNTHRTYELYIPYEARSNKCLAPDPHSTDQKHPELEPGALDRSAVTRQYM